MKQKLSENQHSEYAERKPGKAGILIAVSVLAVLGMLLSGCGASGSQPEKAEETVVTETQIRTEPVTEPATEPVTEPAAEPQTEGIPETEAVTDAGISQVVPMADGAVAVLYVDGTVRVSGNADYEAAVSKWTGVEKLYYYENEAWEISAFMGLTGDGTVLTADGSLSKWKNVKELYFFGAAVAAVTENGTVLAHSFWDEDVSYLTDQTKVEAMAFSEREEMIAVLKKDGQVKFVNIYDPEYPMEDMPVWKDVKELRNYGSGFYAVLQDGTVQGREYAVQEDGTMRMQGYASFPGLQGAVKVVDYDIWLFGLSEDGRLLTHNGGNIYTNDGFLVVDVPASGHYSGEVDISQLDRVRDIVTVYRGLVLLNEDGTAVSINDYLDWDLSTWSNVTKLCESDGEEGIRLYGLRQDGSVVVNQYTWDPYEQTVTGQYRGWKLQDLYAGFDGAVGLTADGKLVGDGIYENLDFSVFER